MKGAKKSSANTAFYLIIGVVAIGGIAALTYLSTRPRDTGVSQVDPTLPPVQSGGYVLGSASAPLEVVEFADFECPACERFTTLTEPDVRQRLINTGQVRLRFIDFPLSMHRNSFNASRAAACADEQGKFWEMHDVIYANQDRWNTQATNNPDRVLKEIARQVNGLDMNRFEDCVDSRRTQAKIQAHLRIAEERRIPSTPTFIFGDRQISNALSYDEFKRLADEAIARGARNTFSDSLNAATSGDTAAAPRAGGDTTRAPAPR